MAINITHIRRGRDHCKAMVSLHRPLHRRFRRFAPYVDSRLRPVKASRASFSAFLIRGNDCVISIDARVDGAARDSRHTFYILPTHTTCKSGLEAVSISGLYRAIYIEQRCSMKAAEILNNYCSSPFSLGCSCEIGAALCFREMRMSCFNYAGSRVLTSCLSALR